MEDLFKKFVNAGVGFLSQGNKKVQSTIDKLVQESKLSEQEGQKIVDELKKSGETRVKELETQFKGLTDSMMKNVRAAAERGAKVTAAAPRSGASQPANSKAGASGTAKKASSAAGKTAAPTKKTADLGSKAATSKKAAAKESAPASAVDGARPASGPND